MFDVLNSDRMNLGGIYEIISNENQKDKIDGFVNTLEIKNYDYVDSYQLDFLYSFCYAGTFADDNNDDLKIDEYSQLILLQFNDIERCLFDKIKKKARECQYSAMVFNTIFENGFNVLVPVNSTFGNHDIAFEKVKNYYENLLEVKADERTNDILFCCIISNDVDCCYRRNATTFNVLVEECFVYDELDESLVNQLNSTVTFTEKREKFNGNEKSFIKLFSVNCNNMGYNIEYVIRYSKKNFQSGNYSEIEMEKSIRFIYSDRRNVFGSKQKYGKIIKSKVDNSLQIMVELDSKLEEFRSFLNSYFDDENKVGFAITYLKGLLK